MNESVHHVLLTRFNLPSAGVESLIRAREGWLRDRVVLFERYCLPSVVAQSNRNFSWIIYFDTESPAWLREKIDLYAGRGDFVPLFRVSVSPAELVADIRQVLGEPRAQLITTNLDNDDGLATDFVDRLQQQPAVTEAHAVYCVNGLIKSGTEVYARVDRHNAFCSVQEPWDDPKTCWSEWHNLLAKTMPVREVGGRPAWLQVIHGANVSNRVRGRLVDPARYASIFPGQLDDVVRPSTVNLLSDRLVARPLRTAKESGRAAAKWFVMRTIGKGGLDRAKLLLARRTKGGPEDLEQG